MSAVGRVLLFPFGKLTEAVTKCLGAWVYKKKKTHRGEVVQWVVPSRLPSGICVINTWRAGSIATISCQQDGEGWCFRLMNVRTTGKCFGKYHRETFNRRRYG